MGISETKQVTVLFETNTQLKRRASRLIAILVNTAAILDSAAPDPAATQQCGEFKLLSDQGHHNRGRRPGQARKGKE